MGCLGVGLQHAGFDIMLRVDNNQKMLGFAAAISPVPTLLGDVTDPSIVGQIRSICPIAGVLAGGIACQPYSRLGAQQMQLDQRSLTLPGILKIEFQGRFPIILLECVGEALSCSWVQALLQQFCQATGYVLSQDLIHLHRT